MRVFVTVVDLGSQSAAAEHLDLSRPVVSRYLAELEDWVGARLMHRTTRKLSLTAAGTEVLPRCRQMLELSGDMQAAVGTPDDAPRGMLRISASTSFGQAQLASARPHRQPGGRTHRPGDPHEQRPRPEPDCPAPHGLPLGDLRLAALST
jgi:DNA-binding transcriptional LysR family regulator